MITCSQAFEERFVAAQEAKLLFVTLYIMVFVNGRCALPSYFIHSSLTYFQ